MRIGYYCAALGTREQQKRLEVTANNIANVNTAGYKKDTVRFKDFLVETSAPRLEQGSVRTTENPLNIALKGNGFLRVRTDQGVLYTRNGDLTLGRDGTLTTLEGWPVLGKGGPIKVPGSAVRITEDGQVFDVQQGAGAHQNVSVGTLDLVRFPPETALNKARNGYFSPADPQATPLPASDCTVQQGALEQANFNVVEEMTNMISASHSYQTNLDMMNTAKNLLIKTLALGQ